MLRAGLASLIATGCTVASSGSLFDKADPASKEEEGDAWPEDCVLGWSYLTGVMPRTERRSTWLMDPVAAANVPAIVLAQGVRAASIATGMDLKSLRDVGHVPGFDLKAMEFESALTGESRVEILVWHGDAFELFVFPEGSLTVLAHRGNHREQCYVTNACYLGEAFDGLFAHDDLEPASRAVITESAQVSDEMRPYVEYALHLAALDNYSIEKTDRLAQALATEPIAYAALSAKTLDMTYHAVSLRLPAETLHRILFAPPTHGGNPHVAAFVRADGMFSHCNVRTTPSVIR